MDPRITYLGRSVGYADVRINGTGLNMPERR